jgi:hypothetical protein
LSGIDIGDSIIYGRIECYSCKKAGSDKKLYKSLEQQFQDEIARSPDLSALSVSPFGPLTEKSSRLTLIELISTLNAAFPDYDFSDLKAEQFRKEPSLHSVVTFIDTMLSNVVPRYEQFKVRMWNAIDQEIQLHDSQIYSLIPDPDSDPFAEDGNIWNFNFFFYNKKVKRIIFFTCRAQRKIPLAMTAISDVASTRYDTCSNIDPRNIRNTQHNAEISSVILVNKK